MLNKTKIAAAAIAVLSATAAAAQLNVPIGGAPLFAGWGGSSSWALTRPANTTTYAVSTGWNTAAAGVVPYFIFPAACRVPGGVTAVMGITIVSSANPSTKLFGKLFLFSSPPSSPIADQAPFTLSAADTANLAEPFQGIPFFLSATLESATISFASGGPFSHPVRCSANSANLYGEIEVTSPYTPAAGETLTVTLQTAALN